VTVLILGGTAEAREPAVLLVRDGVDVVSSLAGRVARPRLPVGRVRVGGGAAALVAGLAARAAPPAGCHGRRPEGVAAPTAPPFLVAAARRNRPGDPVDNLLDLFAVPPGRRGVRRSGSA
jgi:hypothetical protein